MRPFVILSLLLASACAGSAPQQAPGRAGPAATLAEIRALVGEAACTADADCHSLPLGAKPCGGPESWLAWSSAHTPAVQLQALAERYRAERQAEARASGLMSDCRFVADPGAACRAGTCQPGTAVPAAR
jgi:hypothetical protein